MTKKNYLAPAVEVVRVDVEKGFALSQEYGADGAAGTLQEGNTYDF